MKYVKKQTFVEAYQLPSDFITHPGPDENNLDWGITLCFEDNQSCFFKYYPEEKLFIHQASAYLTGGYLGDYVVRNEEGEIHVIEKEKFENDYQPL